MKPFDVWSRLDTKNKWRLDGWTDGRTERQNVKTKVCSCAPIRKRRNWLMTLTDWTGRRRLSWSACSGREKWGPNRSTCPTAAERRRRFRQRNNFAPPFSLARVFVSSTVDTVWARTDCYRCGREEEKTREWMNERATTAVVKVQRPLAPRSTAALVRRSGSGSWQRSRRCINHRPTERASRRRDDGYGGLASTGDGNCRTADTCRWIVGLVGDRAIVRWSGTRLDCDRMGDQLWRRYTAVPWNRRMRN